MASSTKEFLKKWGPYGVITHFSVAIVGFSCIYTGLQTNREAMFEYLPESLPTTGTTLFIAGAAHKMTMPIRLPITAFLTPFVKRGIDRTPGGRKFMSKFAGYASEQASQAQTGVSMFTASTKKAAGKGVEDAAKGAAKAAKNAGKTAGKKFK